MALQNTDNPYTFGANTPGGNGSDISGPPVQPVPDLVPRIWAAAPACTAVADQASCASYQGWKLAPKTVTSDPTGD